MQGHERSCTLLVSRYRLNAVTFGCDEPMDEPEREQGCAFAALSYVNSPPGYPGTLPLKQPSVSKVSANMESIGIIGVGGVGGYFGGKLCQLQESGEDVSVSFVARGKHLQRIQESGLLLSSESDGDLLCQPSVATDNFRSLPPLDLCLICVKEFDLPAALSSLKPLLGESSIVVPLLNGVDVYSRVREVIKTGIVLPACVYVGTHIERPGKVVQKGGACRILFGPDPQYPNFSADNLTNLFGNANIKSEWTLDIQSEIWKKFIFICSFGLVSAAFGKTLGEIVDDEILRAKTLEVIGEAIALAKESGVCLPRDIAETSMLKAQSFPYETKTSFQRDFESPSKSDERDLFAGAMIRIASDLRIQVPKTKLICDTLERIKPFSDNPSATRDGITTA